MIFAVNASEEPMQNVRSVQKMGLNLGIPLANWDVPMNNTEMGLNVFLRNLLLRMYLLDPRLCIYFYNQLNCRMAGVTTGTIGSLILTAIMGGSSSK